VHALQGRRNPGCGYVLDPRLGRACKKAESIRSSQAGLTSVLREEREIGQRRVAEGGELLLTAVEQPLTEGEAAGFSVRRCLREAALWFAHRRSTCWPSYGYCRSF